MSTSETTTPASKPNWTWPVLVAGAIAWYLLYGQLQSIANWLTFNLLGLTPGTPLADSINFFLYDVPKILMLLSGMIFLVTIIRSFFSPEQTRALLGGKREGLGNILAAGLGVLTPFCSCSAVPLFIGFVESGIPLGVTFSFLIAAPMVNEIALGMLFGMFGWKIAGLYLFTGLTVAIISGVIIGRLKMERYVEDFVWQIKMSQAEPGLVYKPAWETRLRDAAAATREIVSRVWLFVVIGIAVGAIIHGYVPEDFMVEIMGHEAWWSVPVAVIIGIPLYANAAGIMPVVYVLMEKGAALGTVLAFMMAVVALSLPEMIILRRVLKPQLLVTFVGIVGVAIVLTGYLFNLVI